MAENWAKTVATVLEAIAVALERFAMLRDRVPAEPKRYDSDCAEFVKEAGSLMECLSIIKEVEPFPADDNLRLFLAKLSRSLDGLNTDMQLLSGRVPKELNDYPAAARHLIADSLPDLYTHPEVTWQMMVDRRIALHDELHGELVTWADRLRALPVPDDAKPSHSADFTFVNWYGTEYTFALGVQSSAVKALWGEWEKTRLGLHQDTIRDAVDPERDSFRMDKAFRNHPAFGTMIQNTGDGKYKLAPPEAGKAPDPKAKKSAGIPAKSRRKPR